MYKVKPKLNISLLVKEAKAFCSSFSRKNHENLVGITDGKTIGTYLEQSFKKFLSSKYTFVMGSSANGIDFPSRNINTDIKVTSINQPQSSCPYRSIEQKIYGLGYNLLIFVYTKIDKANGCIIRINNLIFVDKSRTADFTITKRLREMIKDGANKFDILGFLEDRNIPADEIILDRLSQKILENTPKQGYLTISNAFQWRLQYSRLLTLDGEIQGVIHYES